MIVRLRFTFVQWNLPRKRSLLQNPTKYTICQRFPGKKHGGQKLQTFGEEHAHLTNMAAIYLTQQNIRETHVLASQDQP